MSSQSLRTAISVTTALMISASHAFAAAPVAFETYCFKCHDSGSADGDLDLETFLAKKHDVNTADELEEILSRLKERDMPPKRSKKQPSDGEHAEMLAWAGAQVDAIALANADDPGVVIMPRLTRGEHRNVIRDLSGGVVTKAGEYLPNEGGAGEGFANVGAAQGMGATQFGKYLEAGKGALRFLRVSAHDGFVWRAVPHEAVDEPKAAIKEATDDLIERHFLQQQKWGAQHRDAAAQGVSFDAAVKAPLLTVLMSPEFLYRGARSGDIPVAVQSTRAAPNIERGNAAKGDRNVAPPCPLTFHELASRLSVFLWASIPDDELLKLASEDKLRDPAVLKAQAARMVKNPRAASLATDFAAQLWKFSDFETFTGPDEKRFKEFTPSLRQAMLDEVTTSLGDLFRTDAPLTNLLDADHTFANEELANHCGVKWTNVPKYERGDEDTSTLPNWYRVTLPQQRGGLATMALFLTKTSQPLRTSPVQRGNWVLETLIGHKIPPPPPNVKKLSEDDKNAEGLNIQQQLAQHRAAENCAACHAKIDPPGIALENFDPIGRWRDTERDGAPIVNSEKLHDGSEMKGVDGLKRWLKSREDEFFANFNGKLLGYALGRAVLPGDRALLARMSAALQRDGHKFSSLVEAIVTSPQFTGRRQETTAVKTANSL